MEQKLRIGLIGLGQRGMATLRRYDAVEQAEITAIADLSAEAIERATYQLRLRGHNNVTAFQGETGWTKLCALPNIDLVYICTDWASHAHMAIEAMRLGRDVALEVPAAMTVRECWNLVDTVEQTGRCFTMLENCCYDTFHLGILEIKRKGLFGDITHAEGAYSHDLRSDNSWMSYTVSDHPGNPYPTHGLGPVCQLMDIHHGDRLKSLVSMSAPNKVNNTLLKTELGRTILIQFDERTPRPYSRIQTLCGTRGFAQKYPLPTIQIDGQTTLTGAEAEAYIHSQHDDKTKALIQRGKDLGVENLMNFIMDHRLVNRLLQHRAPDISVYDAALWSCITELSAQSVLLGSTPVEIPDFTRGRWKNDAILGV